MSDDPKHCVITGCIASNLLDKPTYIGKFQNDDQKFELTIPYARIMATRLKGKPLDAEHMEGNGTIGTILHSWIEGRKWFIQALVDQSTLAGIDMAKAIAGGHGNPFPERIGEFSLQHCGFDPVGVAVVVRGARDGCTIDNASLVTDKDLETIKQQKYNIDDISVPEHFPSDPPRIAASFGEMSNHHFALRNPAPNATYQPADPNPDTEPFMKNIKNSEQDLAAQKAAAAAAAQQARNPEERRKALMKELAELGPPAGAGQSQGASQWKNTGDPQRTGNPQFDQMLDDLHNGHSPDATGNLRTSNQHTLYSNPQDAAEARLREIAGVFDTRIPTNQQKEQAARALFEVAQRTKAQSEELAKKDQQLQLLTKKLNEAESRNATHQSDIEKQRKQAAMMLKRLIQKNTPQATATEEQELESGVADMSEGKSDEAMGKLLPAMIRASAFCDMRDAAASIEDDGAQEGRYSKLMNKALGLPAEGLISATGANRKRSYETSQRNYSGPDIPAAAESSSRNWEKEAMDGVPPQLAALMHQMTHDPTCDTERVSMPAKTKFSRHG